MCVWWLCVCVVGMYMYESVCVVGMCECGV